MLYTFPVYLRIYIPSFGSRSNRMLSEFEMTNLRNSLSLFEVYNNRLINTTIMCFLGFHTLEKNLLSHFFSEFLRTNSITGNNNFLEFVISN